VAWQHTPCWAAQPNFAYTSFHQLAPELSASGAACCCCSKDRAWQAGLFLFACGNVGSFYAYGEWQLYRYGNGPASTAQDWPAVACSLEAESCLSAQGVLQPLFAGGLQQLSFLKRAVVGSW
jgi:hypothetical protein